MLVSLVLAPVFSFNSPSSFRPLSTLTVRGRVLTVVYLAITPFSVVCLAIAPLSPRPPATSAVRGRFLTGGLPYYSDSVSFN